MKPPDNTAIYEGELATFWFDENGILCAIAKPANRTIEIQQRSYAFIREITNNTKVCLLIDNSTGSLQDKETREYVESQIPLHFTAMAFISDSAVGKAIPQIFLTFHQSPIPLQVFNSEAEAKEWLMQFL